MPPEDAMPKSVLLWVVACESSFDERMRLSVFDIRPVFLIFPQARARQLRQNEMARRGFYEPVPARRAPIRAHQQTPL